MQIKQRIIDNIKWLQDNYPTISEKELERKFDCSMVYLYKNLTKIRKQGYNIPYRKKK